jgi:hypothetical protein
MPVCLFQKLTYGAWFVIILNRYTGVELNFEQHPGSEVKRINIIL